MRIVVLLLVLAGWAACDSGTMLDRPFNPQTYDDDLMFMLEKKQLSQSELYHLIYAIVRQREYFNYEIEGKTYREILAIADNLLANGMPVEQLLSRNGEQEFVTVKVENEGTAFTRKEGSNTRLEKKLKFTAEYANNSDKDLVLLSTTFLFYGPFQDYLTSSAYEINCLLEPGQRTRVNFLAEPTNIRDNMLHGGSFDMRLLSVDSLLQDLRITVGGNSITHDLHNFTGCKFGSARLTPIKNYLSKDSFDPEQQVIRDANGRAQSIQWGDAHYVISDSDEVMRIKEK